MRKLTTYAESCFIKMTRAKLNAKKRKAKVNAQSDSKEQECINANNLSANLDEAVETSIVKSSADEAESSPR